MELTRHFTKLGRNDAPIAGGKGASLGEMTQAGIPVPPGFVVLSSAFERFLEETDLNAEIDSELHKVNHKEIHLVERASEVIRALILSKEMPKDIADDVKVQFAKLDTKYVAVRSSATAEDGADHAWAGQLESYLNTTEDDVLDKVKRCWSSLFTPRAIFYRFEKGLHASKISVAVVVQKMVDSEVSGIAFSVHPVTEDWNQLIIEAGFGLGEAIVSGQVTPDSYVVEKKPRRIIDINVSTQERGLYRADKPSEHGWNEWLQIAEPKASSQVLTEAQVNELSNIIVGIEKHYGFPCDIEWAFEAGKFYIVQSRPITTLAMKMPPAPPTPSQNTSRFNKDDYARLGQWIAPVLEYELWLDWANTPESKNMNIPRTESPWITIDGHYFRLKKDAHAFIKDTALEEFKQNKYDFVRSIIEIGKKISQECLQASKEVKGELSFDEFLKYFDIMRRLRFPWMSFFPIDEAATEYIKEYADKNSLNVDEVLASLPQLSNSVSEDQEKLLSFKNQIKKEGVAFTIEDIQAKNPQLASEIINYQKETEYMGTHHMWGEERTLPKLIAAIEGLHESTQTAETSKKSDLEILSVMSEVSKWRLECAQSSARLAYSLRPSLIKFAQKGGLTYDDVIQLTTKEIASLTKGELANTAFIKDRRDKFALYREGSEIKILTGKEYEEVAETFCLNETHEDVDSIKGNIGNKGKVTGVVAIVRKPQDNSKVKPGMILVAPETTPDFIPAMGIAAGFVTDLGGITSHAAIVAREMGKPCITGTKIATKVLKDGDMVEVDADKGIVRIIKPEINLIEEDIQLELWLERKNLSPLIISLFHFLEGPEMQKLIGGGFSKEISVIKEGVSYWIRPATEIAGLVKLHQEFISKSDIKDLKNLLDKAIDIYNAADENIIAIANSNDEQFSQLVKTFLNEMSDILLYTTTIPYFLLSALENSGLEKAKYELVHSKCEEMRGDSKYSKAQEVFMPKLVQYLKTHHGLTEEEAKDITYDELISLLNDGKWEKDEKLSQRANSSVFWLNFKTKKHEFSYDQRVFDYFYNKYIKVDIQNNQEIIGSIANKGFVKGRVVIVNSPDELGKVHEGDIIVSRNTNPSLMPALKKCAAIVTDEGGIACHAAIVSRELNKPCIIGTKIATKALKDGDMIEVDADRGIVRILKNEAGTVGFITPELKDFDTSTYHFDGLWKNDLFATCFWQDCWVPDVVERLKLDMQSVGVMNLKGGHYLVEKAVRAQVDAQMKRMVDEKNEAFFKNLVKVSDEIFTWGIAKGEELRSKEATLENFRDFVETAKKINFLWLIGATYTNWPTEEKLGEAIIEDKFPPEHALDIIPKIVTPLSEYQQGVAELRKVIGSKTFAEVQADAELFSRLKAHAEKYAWIEMLNFVGALLTPERLYEQIAHTDKEAHEHSTFVPEKPLSPKLQFVAQCMSDAGYVKQAGAEYFSIFTERVLPFLNKVAEKIGVTYREMMCLSTQEIEKALQGALDGQELKNRATRRIGVNDWALIAGKNGKLIFTEELADVNLMLEKMIPKTGKDAEELIGQIGNRGKYVGPARVIMNTYDFGKMQPGDVLVSTMTTPDFVILMQKAGAIVTDIGGLLCHAAIVSREINKPCVIGTKFATQILKDGMMVEVDGDKGVVKILSENVPSNINKEENDPTFIEGKKWFLTVTRNMSFWHQYLLIDGFYNHSRDFGVDFNLEQLSLTVDSTQTHCFFYQPHYGEYVGKVNTLFQSEDSINTLRAIYAKYAESLLSSLEECKKNLTIENLKDFFSEYKRYTAGLMITTAYGRSGGELLMKRLKDVGFSDEEIPEIISCVTYPSDHTPLFNSQMDLLKIAADIQNKNSNDSSEKISLWLSRYANIPVNYCDEPWTEIDAKKQLEGLLAKDCSKEIQNLEAGHEQRVAKAKEKINEINDPEVSILAFALAQATFLNEYRKNVFSTISLGYRPIFTQIAEKAGSSNWRDCFYLTPEEMLGLLEGKKIDLKQIKTKRSAAAIMIGSDGKVKFVGEKETARLFDYIKLAQGQKVSETTETSVKGFSANRGKVRGIVKIILSSKDFPKLNPGEILVTTMTSVDFVPVMERAAAFVTNEGGITSHASIVAREMNKPCILGTKVATQVLKDGMMVEVDADKGVVTILA